MEINIGLYNMELDKYEERLSKESTSLVKDIVDSVKSIEESNEAFEEYRRTITNFSRNLDKYSIEANVSRWKAFLSKAIEIFLKVVNFISELFKKFARTIVLTFNRVRAKFVIRKMKDSDSIVLNRNDSLKKGSGSIDTFVKTCQTYKEPIYYKQFVLNELVDIDYLTDSMRELTNGVKTDADRIKNETVNSLKIMELIGETLDKSIEKVKSDPNNKDNVKCVSLLAEMLSLSAKSGVKEVRKFCEENKIVEKLREENITFDLDSFLNTLGNPEPVSSSDIPPSNKSLFSSNIEDIVRKVIGEKLSRGFSEMEKDNNGEPTFKSVSAKTIAKFVLFKHYNKNVGGGVSIPASDFFSNTTALKKWIYEFFPEFSGTGSSLVGKGGKQIGILMEKLLDSVNKLNKDIFRMTMSESKRVEGVFKEVMTRDLGDYTYKEYFKVMRLINKLMNTMRSLNYYFIASRIYTILIADCYYSGVEKILKRIYREYVGN